ENTNEQMSNHKECDEKSECRAQSTRLFAVTPVGDLAFFVEIDDPNFGAIDKVKRDERLAHVQMINPALVTLPQLPRQRRFGRLDCAIMRCLSVRRVRCPLVALVAWVGLLATEGCAFLDRSKLRNVGSWSRTLG